MAEKLYTAAEIKALTDHSVEYWLAYRAYWDYYNREVHWLIEELDRLKKLCGKNRANADWQSVHDRFVEASRSGPKHPDEIVAE